MVYCFFLNESECGQLTQDVGLEAWDLTPGPSTDLSIVDVKSPDASHTEGQSNHLEEESIREPLVCASHDLPICTIGQMSADMLHCFEGSNKEGCRCFTAQKIRDFVDMLAKFLVSSCLVGSFLFHLLAPVCTFNIYHVFRTFK
ncbi:hypothetical protein AB205_0121990 [Aquarana catesbeiana]|uniref:Uncharacterized protein n=1 Tax=Aquarana catesbeiana TaxID=8400 RepID=A0A2G9SFD5_AQUCT|nr:hypothetical protein AB205_0121990 [Aquarana catesbeiana]